MRLNNKDFKRHRRIVATQNFIRFVRAFLIIGVLALAVITISNFDLKIKNISFMKYNFHINISGGPDCANLSFQDTAICLNNFARKNFFYNLTDDDLTLSVQDMIQRGGDCKDYTDFYEKYINYYGYNQTQRVEIFVGKEKSYSIYHTFLIASHSSGYCHMDINDLECYQYVNDKGEIRK